jgi:flagellar capping protein FliD
MFDNDNYDVMNLIKKIHDLDQMLKDEREEFKDIYSKMKKQTSSAEFESFYLREENKRLTNENMLIRERLAYYEQ